MTDLPSLDYKRKEDGLNWEITIAYIIFAFLYQFIVIAGMWRAVKNLREEFKYQFSDTIKISQISFIIWYLLIRNTFTLLWFFNIKALEFFHLLILTFDTFFFYFFEWVNNMWWMSFILHLTAVKDIRESNNKVFKVWKKEVILLIFIFTLGIIWMIIWIVLISFSLWNSWGKYEMYFLDDKPSDENKICRHLTHLSIDYHKMLLGIAFSAAISKIIIGTIMLRKMRTKLYYLYQEKMRNIIFTMIATIVIISINYTINQINNFKEFFWTMFIVQVEHIDTFTLIRKWSFELLNSVFETFLMFYTVENIEFRSYILILWKGRGILHHASKISIFLKFRKKNNKYYIHEDGLSFKEESSYPKVSLMDEILNEEEGSLNQNNRSPLIGKALREDFYGNKDKSSFISTCSDEK